MKWPVESVKRRVNKNKVALYFCPTVVYAADFQS